MNRKGMRGVYWAMLNRLLDQLGVPDGEDRLMFRKEVHDGLKQAFGIDSTEGLSDDQFHSYLTQVEIELKTEYGLDADLKDELKFE